MLFETLKVVINALGNWLYWIIEELNDQKSYFASDIIRE